MQFEINHNVTEKVCKVTFINPHKIGRFGWTQLNETFEYLGANQCDDASYLFPSFITSQVIQEIIHNTCFVCGGLMQDSEVQNGGISPAIKVRKCSSCGHSHT